jgi:hypothetical protein
MSQPSLVPRARPLAGPGQSPGLASLHPVAWAGNGHEVFADSTLKSLALVRMRFDKYMEFHDYIGPSRPKTAVVKTYPVPQA